ncbi:probable ran GTPase activating protein 1 [Ustilago trichophora]|uniref:Probable ran GTPase activating protein 1 n=1 Tax=Ustilago trichophora TaxID=86804 RepID=A0A5C3EDT9_9BASI|nr:probable ran GTPase activating protein 1 [Ustilago trichophora]
MSDESKIFSLVGQGLKLDTKADIQPHLDRLDQITDLEEIHLGGNTLGVEACQALADVLKNKRNLKVADFADIFTGRLITEIPDALRALCDALTDHTSLVELNLSDNAFGGRSAEPMVNFLKNNHSFSVLKLNNNGLGITGGTIVAEALFQAAQNLKAKGLESQLRTVICGRNRLENGSAPVWAKAYAAHAGLVEVRMFQNGIRMEGIEAISKGLASCPNLEVLDLQDNTATLRGSRAIAACLPKWPNLKTLNLSDCLLKPKGGALVFGALANGSNKALETIQVQYCDLDRKVLDQLASAIELHLTKLTKLDINGNWADEEDECIENIKKALAKHGHDNALLELDEMDPDGEESEAEDEDEDGDQDADEEQESEPAAAKTKRDETDELAAALAKTSVSDEK